jgi:hypothetical protein
VVLIENCPNHITSDVLDLPTAIKVRVVTPRRHITQIFQLPDLILFAFFRRQAKYRLPFNELRSINFLDHVRMKFAQRLNPPKICAPFHAIRVEFDAPAAPCCVVFHMEKLSESEDFAELGNSGDP